MRPENLIFIYESGTNIIFSKEKIMEGSSSIADAVKGMQLPTIQPAVAEALKSIQPLKENSALAEALRNANTFLTSPALENLRRQMSQLSEAVRPYQLIFDAIRPYNALQEKLRSITEGLPHALDTDNESDEADTEEPETDCNEENPEESNPNE